MNSEFNSLIKSRNLTELPYQKDLLTNTLYQSSKKPIVFAAGTSAGKTFTMIMWLELFYKNVNGYKPTLIIPASKTVLRDNTEEALKEFKPTFSYSIITNRNDLETAIKNKVQVIVALPQTLNKSIDILPKFERFVLDEAHQWYFKSVIKKVITKTKPNVQLLLTGSPYRFNAQADKFIFKYVPVMELYDLGHVHNAKIEVVSSAYDFKQTDWLSSFGNLKSQKTNSVAKAKSSLDIVCDEMINKLRSTTKSKYTRNWNAVNKFSSLFNELDKTIIYTHSKKQADTFHKILNSKKGLEGKVLISHSENDGKSELFKQFQTDDSIKILVAVDRGRLGFNMPNLYNIVDFTMTQSLEMLQQMYGRLLRKSPTGKQKCYYKVATKNTAEYYVDLMTAMLCLATNDDPTYYYSMYNGKNMGGIRIPKVLLNNKKSTKGSSNSSKSKSSKPYISLSELGIPNDLNIFRQSILHSSDGSFDSIAWTTLDNVRREFFEVKNKNQFFDKMPYEEAKKFVKTLKLKSVDEWRAYCNGEFKHLPTKPINLPTAVYNVYKNDGFTNFCDFLGMSDKSRNKQYAPLSEVKKIFKKHNIKSTKQWIEFCKNGNKPTNIPRNLFLTYSKDKDWKGFSDLTGNVQAQEKQFRDFDSLKKFIKKLNFKSMGEYKRWKNRPNDIPAAPEYIRQYKSKWTNWNDFLGIK